MNKFLSAIFLSSVFELIVMSATLAETLDQIVEVCRVDFFCNAMAAAPVGSTPDYLKSTNPCFQKKVNACYSATAQAGVAKRGNHSDLARTILHGNFCGWRNLAVNPDGSEVNWRSEAEVLKATQSTVALDKVDEVCKWHDIQYFTPPYAICEADQAFIKKMQTLAWDYRVSMPDNLREEALALAGAIQKNSSTCKEIQLMKLGHIWN